MRCNEEILLVKKMEKDFEDKNLRVIWLGFQDKESKIKEFIQKHGIEESVCYDNGDAVSRQYGIEYGAGVVIIDSGGTVRTRLAKGFSEKKLKEALNLTLNREGNGKSASD